METSRSKVGGDKSKRGYLLPGFVMVSITDLLAHIHLFFKYQLKPVDSMKRKSFASARGSAIRATHC